MSLLDAIIMAIVQGLTEFLPISSSGHLAIIGRVLGLGEDDPMAFVVLLHLASAMAVILYARRDLLSMLTPAGRPLLYLLVIGTIPAAVLGVLFNDLIEEFFKGNMLVVGLGLSVTAAALWLANRLADGAKGFTDLRLPHGLAIGLAQAVAMVPGVSRSGSTICTGILLGMRREQAVRFSFLLAVPIILGAGAKTALDIPSLSSFLSLNYIVAFVVCFVVSLGSLRLLVGVVRGKKLSYFSLYCLALGAGCIIWHLLGAGGAGG